MAVPHNGGVPGSIPAGDGTVDDLTVEGNLSVAGTAAVTGATTLAAVTADSITADAATLTAATITSLTADIAATSVSITDAAGDFTATNVETALAELQTDAEADSAALTAHIDDAAAAHAASAISILDVQADFTATDVEGALAELQSDHEADSAALTAHIADTADAHDASAISILDTAANFTATDVEGALAELSADIASTGIPATIVDAAGDLIIASAADTVTRLAIGTAGQRPVVNAAGTSLEYVDSFVGVKVYKAAGQSIADNTRTTLLWDAEDFDTHAFHSTATNTDRLTVPAGQAGYYVPFINLSFGGDVDGYRDIQICKNGSLIIVGNDRRAGHLGDGNFATTFEPVLLAATDYLIARFYQNSGAAMTVYGDNDFTDPVYAPRFGMYKVG